jgi:hypothetical protein
VRFQDERLLPTLNRLHSPELTTPKRPSANVPISLKVIPQQTDYSKSELARWAEVVKTAKIEAD